jgi:hypothetical protein
MPSACRIGLAVDEKLIQGVEVEAVVTDAKSLNRFGFSVGYR